VLPNQINRFETVLALGYDIDIGEALDQVSEFVSCQLLIVDDDCGERHRQYKTAWELRQAGEIEVFSAVSIVTAGKGGNVAGKETQAYWK
jgi:hypothetical protein